MKFYNIKTLIVCLLAVVFTACEDDLPKNPTITSPLSALEMTVSNIDYVAKPKLNNGILIDTLFISVRRLDSKATIKAIHLESGYTSDLKQGDIVSFEKDVLPIVLTKNGTKYPFYIKLEYKEPAILYLVKTSDRDKDGKRNYLDTEKSERLASLNNDENYEGFIDLTATNWDNICLVAPNLKQMYDCDKGLSEQSSAKLTFVEKTTSGNSYYFASSGPWANWLWTNGNERIISPGVWKFDFNTKSKELNLVETQWAVSGNAIGNMTAMLYSPQKKEWSLTANLNAGKLRFVTIAVTNGDPTLSYGELGSTTDTGYLESQGRDIVIETAGNYKITADFSKPPYYVYSLSKN